MMAKKTKPIVFNYNKYLTLKEENDALKASIANLEIRCRIAESDHRKPGRWEYQQYEAEDREYCCSNCGHETDWMHKSPYCPECGSRMEVEE